MQGQMDHGLANARFNEQQENIAPILDALRKYGSGVAERVSAFADDPAQALYGGFADTMGINLDRPMDEYAEMARNPQAGEIDPNSPAVLEAMGWLPGPMGALGTIAGKGGKTASRPIDELTEQIKRKHELDRLELSERKDSIVLDMIEVDPSKRKQGLGTKAMEDILSYADQSGKRLELSPGMREGGKTTSRNRLIKFYKRFGFVENKGRNKDFTISEAMYRPPKQTENLPLIDALRNKEFY